MIQKRNDTISHLQQSSQLEIVEDGAGSHYDSDTSACLFTQKKYRPVWTGF